MRAHVKPGFKMPSQRPAFRRSVAALMAERTQRTAERIQRERKLRGQEPIEVAYKIGVNVRTFERWEAGTVEPRLSNIKALADEWGVEIKDLRPDLEAEADQLDRIEEMLASILRRLEPDEEADLEPSEVPPDDDADARSAEQSRRESA